MWHFKKEAKHDRFINFSRLETCQICFGRRCLSASYKISLILILAFKDVFGYSYLLKIFYTVAFKIKYFETPSTSSSHRSHTGRTKISAPMAILFMSSTFRFVVIRVIYLRAERNLHMRAGAEHLSSN